MHKIIDARINTGDLVARETNFNPGRNGNFDVSLFRRPNGEYFMEIFMKIQFFFVDGDEDETGWMKKGDHVWTSDERKFFMHAWYLTVRQQWNDVPCGKLKDGYDMSMLLRFFIQEGGDLWDHFEIDVEKIPPGASRISEVGLSDLSADVNLDSMDFTPKATGQVAVVHEFGHMIALPDEYKQTSPYFGEMDSIMHAGTHVKPRHFTHLISWANRHIPEPRQYPDSRASQADTSRVG